MEIKKGDMFRCIKDVVMATDEIAYISQRLSL